MSTLKIDVANFFAKSSCPAWNSIAPLRRISRLVYRKIMETGAEDYPYADPDFANWPESDEPGKYSLVSDSDNFVIRHSPSYVNWLVQKKLHRHLKRPEPGPRKAGERAFDAKHWGEILEFNGWTKLTGNRHPMLSDAINKTHFIGVIPEEGENGQLVWFIDVAMEYLADLDLDCVSGWYVTTYRDGERKYYVIPATSCDQIIWYMEPNPRKMFEI